MIKIVYRNIRSSKFINPLHAHPAGLPAPSLSPTVMIHHPKKDPTNPVNSPTTKLIAFTWKKSRRDSASNGSRAPKLTSLCRYKETTAKAPRHPGVAPKRAANKYCRQRPPRNPRCQTPRDKHKGQGKKNKGVRFFYRM